MGPAERSQTRDQRKDLSVRRRDMPHATNEQKIIAMHVDKNYTKLRIKKPKMIGEFVEYVS